MKTVGLQEYLDGIEERNTFPLVLLNDAQWAAFWDMIEQPPAPAGALIRLMRAPAQWDGNPKGENGEAG